MAKKKIAAKPLCLRCSHHKWGDFSKDRRTPVRFTVLRCRVHDSAMFGTISDVELMKEQPERGISACPSSCNNFREWLK